MNIESDDSCLKLSVDNIGFHEKITFTQIHHALLLSEVKIKRSTIVGL